MKMKSLQILAMATFFTGMSGLNVSADCPKGHECECVHIEHLQKKKTETWCWDNTDDKPLKKYVDGGICERACKSSK